MCEKPAVLQTSSVAKTQEPSHNQRAKPRNLPKKNGRLIKLSPLAMSAIIIGSIVVPFNIGIAFSKHTPQLVAKVQDVFDSLSSSTTSSQTLDSLPEIKASTNAKSLYTSKEYAEQLSQTVLLSSPKSVQQQQCHHDDRNESNLSRNDQAEHHHTNDDTSLDEEEASMHEPAGQHLLVDMKTIDPAFLSSPVRLAQALVDLVESTSLTMLSYHCHSNQRGGYSCVGVLLESHVAVHTWPFTGHLALDLFTCGSHSLLPILAIIQKMFQLAAPGGEEPFMMWSHKRRGYRLGGDDDDAHNLEDFDYHRTLGSGQHYKEHIMETSTDFQTVSILDIDRYEERLPDRLLFLDSILQSRRYGDAAYHEALVHPAMMVHKHPKRVAIIGGGEGATLREVLKHTTVEEVVMIEIDERLVQVCRQYIPELSDCSDIQGSTPSCFDDPRATVYFEDAIGWFLERFSPENSSATEKGFDVIIMDSLDPNSAVEFSDVLFGTRTLVDAFSQALGDDGIFIAQVGESDDASDDSVLDYDIISKFVELLEESGFESISRYEETHGGFSAPWEFLVAMKSRDDRTAWFMNEAEMQLALRDRIALTTTPNEEIALRYFDGATFMSYQFPSRLLEDSFCRKHPQECNDGHGFNPDTTDTPLSAFEVISSQVANGGRGVATKERIEEGTYLGIGSCVHSIYVPGIALKTLDEAVGAFKGYSQFWDTLFWGYIEGYGWLDNQYGLPTAGIEPGIWSFVNHGCNGTYNIGERLDVTELTVDPESSSEDIYSDENDVYNPYSDRHFPAWGCQNFVALREIQSGEEIFDNYLVFGGSDDDDWKHNAQELQSICSGGLGLITQYEKNATSVSEEER